MKMLLPVRMLPLLLQTMPLEATNSDEEYLTLWREMRNDLKKLVHMADPPNPDQPNPSNAAEDGRENPATNSGTSSEPHNQSQPLDTPAVTNADKAKQPENPEHLEVQNPPPPAPPKRANLPWKRNKSE